LKYHIFWQKWEDPLTKLKRQLNSHVNNQARQSMVESEFAGEDSQNNAPFIPSLQAMPMISTPMGLMPAPMSDMSTFNFWIGHTNFNITSTIGEIIDRSIGVESLDIFSPYRFRVAIGQAFNEDAVKNNIAQIIHGYLNQDAQTNNITEK